jgi:ATP-dependent Lon protease
VHVPRAPFKDGPSAGVAMAVAAAWCPAARWKPPAATGSDAHRSGAARGGIKEKVLAAQAAGIRRVFLPDRNRADIAEMKGEDLLTGLRVCYADHVRAVIDQYWCRRRRAGQRSVPAEQRWNQRISAGCRPTASRRM